MKRIPVFTILIELQEAYAYRIRMYGPGRYVSGQYENGENDLIQAVIFELGESLEKCCAAEAVWLLTEPKTFDAALTIAKTVLGMEGE